MKLSSGQLLLVKSDFEASEIPVDWSEEKKKPIGQRKTLRNVRVLKNEILFLVEPPISENIFIRYSPQKITTITFLRNNKLCCLTTVVGLYDYVEPIDYSKYNECY